MKPNTGFDPAEETQEQDDLSLRQYLSTATAVIILINILVFLKTDFSVLRNQEAKLITK